METERAFLAFGNVQLTVQKAEEKNLIFKRSIYVIKDITAGEFFTKENVKVIRPGNGLAPKYFEMVLGGKAKVNLKKGTPARIEYLE